MYKIVLISLLLFLGCTAHNNQKILVQGLNQVDANNVVLILANKNISAEKIFDAKESNFSVTVEAKNQVLALQLLADYGEPVLPHQSMGEIFRKDSMISSPLEEFARYTYALNQEIESILLKLDGIIAVKVQVSLPMPSDNLWSAENAKPGAAIFIKYRPGYRIDLLTNRIKSLVSKAVPGLTSDMVEIMPYQKSIN